jgi:hypothetical protein
VNYVFEESKDGGGFVQVYSGTNRFLTLNGRLNGVYTYRVKTTLANWADSAWTNGSNTCTVTLPPVSAPASLTVPAASSNGWISLVSSQSATAGVNYVFEESKDGGPFVQVYNGTNRFLNLSGRLNGIYTYRVKATKTNWSDSAWTNGSNTCTVTLVLAAPASLTVPAASSNGWISLVSSQSATAGVNYVFEESKDGGPFAQVYSGTNRAPSLSGRTNGVYTYRVKVTKTDWADSGWTNGSNTCTVTLP